MSDKSDVLTGSNMKVNALKRLKIVAGVSDMHVFKINLAFYLVKHLLAAILLHRSVHNGKKASGSNADGCKS